MSNDTGAIYTANMNNINYDDSLQKCFLIYIAPSVYRTVHLQPDGLNVVCWHSADII